MSWGAHCALSPALGPQLHSFGVVCSSSGTSLPRLSVSIEHMYMDRQHHGQGTRELPGRHQSQEATPDLANIQAD